MVKYNIFKTYKSIGLSMWERERLLVLESRRTGGLESGDDFRTTDNLQRSSNMRHLWIAKEINCNKKNWGSEINDEENPYRRDIFEGIGLTFR